MRTELWLSDAKKSELLTIESLSIQIDAAETKATPYVERVRTLRKMRNVIVNRARCRNAYRRGIVRKK